MIEKIDKKIILIVDQIIFSATSFVTTLLLGRILGIEKFGMFTSLILVFYFVLSVGQAVIIQPMQIYMNKTTARNEYKMFLLLISALFAMVIVLFGFILSILDLNVLSLDPQFLKSFAIYSSVSVLFDFFRKYFLANDLVHTTLSLDIIWGILQFCLIVSLFLLKDLELTTLFYALTAAILPSLFFAFYSFSKDLNKYVSFDQSKVFIQYHTREGRWLLFTSIAQWWSGNLFVLASGIILGMKAIGALRLGQTIFGVLNILLQTVENYFIPSISRMYQKSKTEAISRMQKWSKKTSLLFLILLTGIFLFSKPIMLLVGGQEFVPYHSVLKGLSVLYMIIVLGYPIRISIRILELNHIFFVAYLISLLFSLFIYQYLLQTLGLNGALLGLITNQLILLIVWQIALIKKEFKLWKSYTSF